MKRRQLFCLQTAMLLFFLVAIYGCAGVSQGNTTAQAKPVSFAPLYPSEEFTASLLTYQNAGLTLRALVAKPIGMPPRDGFPTIVANHGYVPNPAKYGIGRDGTDRRPGDYYRRIPALYTARGFQVVMPDYRGHNSSEGFADISGDINADIARYATDVNALVAVLDRVPDIDMDRLFLWSHSMGGPIALQVLQNQSIFKAATFWSTMSLANVDVDYADIRSSIVIQHSLADTTTPFRNASQFRAALADAGIEAAFFGYDSDRHLFADATMEQAADRDAAIFLRDTHGRSTQP